MVCSQCFTIVLCGDIHSITHNNGHGIFSFGLLLWYYRVCQIYVNHLVIFCTCSGQNPLIHYWDVIMSVMPSQITSLTSVYSTVYSGADQRKHQSSTSLAFVRVIHRWSVNSPHKGPVTRKMFLFDDAIITKPHQNKNNAINLYRHLARTLIYLRGWFRENGFRNN